MGSWLVVFNRQSAPNRTGHALLTHSMSQKSQRMTTRPSCPGLQLLANYLFHVSCRMLQSYPQFQKTPLMDSPHYNRCWQDTFAVRKSCQNELANQNNTKKTRNLRQLWSEIVNKTMPCSKCLLETLGFSKSFLNLYSQFQFLADNHENFPDLELRYCRWIEFYLYLSRDG